MPKKSSGSSIRRDTSPVVPILLRLVNPRGSKSGFAGRLRSVGVLSSPSGGWKSPPAGFLAHSAVVLGHKRDPEMPFQYLPAGGGPALGTSRRRHRARFCVVIEGRADERGTSEQATERTAFLAGCLSCLYCGGAASIPRACAGPPVQSAAAQRLVCCGGSRLASLPRGFSSVFRVGSRSSSSFLVSYQTTLICLFGGTKPGPKGNVSL